MRFINIAIPTVFLVVTKRGLVCINHTQPLNGGQGALGFTSLQERMLDLATTVLIS